MPPKRILDYVGCRVSVTTVDDEVLVGRLLSFDRFGNLVLSDTECERTLTSKKSKGKIERTFLGVVFLRGKAVVLLVHREGPTTHKTLNDSRLRQVETAVADAAPTGPFRGFGPS
jgi:small nuclear ribonucleoprotein (snRNP)-like protein